MRSLILRHVDAITILALLVIVSVTAYIPNHAKSNVAQSGCEKTTTFGSATYGNRKRYVNKLKRSDSSCVLHELSRSTGSSGIDVIDGPFDCCMLNGYWGEKPVLIRQAFDPSCPDIRKAWPSWDDIVSFSSFLDNNDDFDDETEESGYSARLVRHVPGKSTSFDLEIGPFDSEYLNSMMNEKNKKWTLLLNDVGRYVPECQYWMDKNFAFLPRWRRDDAQVSIAGPGGGIGQHVDNYDVFLLQTCGSRIWDIIPEVKLPIADEYESLIPNIPVRILDSRTLEGLSHARYILNPGDMLYLPPRVVHCGTATDDSDRCMTLSVGFRAPSASELVARVAECIQQSIHDTAVKRYTDPQLIWPNEDLRQSTDTSQLLPSISSSVRYDMKKLVVEAVTKLIENELEWDEIVGNVVTEPIRYSENAMRPFEDTMNDDRIQAWGKNAEEVLSGMLESNERLLRPCEGLSFATSSINVNETSQVDRLYVNGEMWEIWNDPRALNIFQKIEAGQFLDFQDIANVAKSGINPNGNDKSSLREIIVSLINDGVLKPCNSTMQQ